MTSEQILLGSFCATDAERILSHWKQWDEAPEQLLWHLVPPMGRMLTDEESSAVINAYQHW